MRQQTPNEVKGVIKGWISDKASNIHVAMPGIIVSYDARSNRAAVQPSGKYKVEDGRSLEYPVIHNAPVQFPMGLGGSAGVTFPLAAGDGCLLIFSDSQLDDFLGGVDSSDPRGHSLNDAVCIPGLYSGAAPANLEHPSDVCISNGAAKMRVGSGGFSGSFGDGTSFAFSGGDLVVNGISVVHHTHPGDSGGTTGQPK